MQIWRRTIKGTKIASKLVLGFICEVLGALWGVSRKGGGGPLAIFWACTLSFLTHWSKMGSKSPFGSILGRFWKGFGKVWGGISIWDWDLLCRSWGEFGVVW